LCFSPNTTAFKDDEIDQACNTLGRKEKCIYTSLVRRPEGNVPIVSYGSKWKANVKIVLKLVD
jgi:hypothetical protein